MALPNGDLITTPFDPQMAYPQDRRMQVDTLNSRDSISMFIRWEGMTVYVLENSKIYILQGGRSNEFWKEFGTGTGTGGTTFVGQFATDDLLPTDGRSAGDYAFVGTGDDFVQYNWDNVSNQWVMAEGQTDMASEHFHIGYKTPLRRPVIFRRDPKDVIVETGGDFVFAPETSVARFIFTGEVDSIRGIETAAADREIKLVNRTGSDIPLRDKASGIPSGSGMDFGGTDYVWVNGSEITLKGNGTYWELAPNNNVAFSDHLDSVNAQYSITTGNLELITNVVDNYTKSPITFKQVTEVPTVIDGIINIQKGSKYYKRVLREYNLGEFNILPENSGSDNASNFAFSQTVVEHDCKHILPTGAYNIHDIEIIKSGIYDFSGVTFINEQEVAGQAINIAQSADFVQIIGLKQQYTGQFYTNNPTGTNGVAKHAIHAHNKKTILTNCRASGFSSRGFTASTTSDAFYLINCAANNNGYAGCGSSGKDFQVFGGEYSENGGSNTVRDGYGVICNMYKGDSKVIGVTSLHNCTRNLDSHVGRDLIFADNYTADAGQPHPQWFNVQSPDGLNIRVTQRIDRCIISNNIAKRGALAGISVSGDMSNDYLRNITVTDNILENNRYQLYLRQLETNKLKVTDNQEINTLDPNYPVENGLLINPIADTEDRAFLEDLDISGNSFDSPSVINLSNFTTPSRTSKIRVNNNKFPLLTIYCFNNICDIKVTCNNFKSFVAVGGNSNSTLNFTAGNTVDVEGDSLSFSIDSGFNGFTKNIGNIFKNSTATIQLSVPSNSIFERNTIIVNHEVSTTVSGSVIRAAGSNYQILDNEVIFNGVTPFVRVLRFTTSQTAVIKGNKLNGLTRIDHSGGSYTANKLLWDTVNGEFDLGTSTIPDLGDYSGFKRGDRLKINNVVTGGNVGFVCTVGGPSPKWEPYGGLESYLITSPYTLTTAPDGSWIKYNIAGNSFIGSPNDSLTWNIQQTLGNSHTVATRLATNRATGEVYSQVYVSSAWQPWIKLSNADTFNQLTDTPASKTGNKNKTVKVSNDETTHVYISDGIDVRNISDSGSIAPTLTSGFMGSRLNFTSSTAVTLQGFTSANGQSSLTLVNPHATNNLTIVHNGAGTVKYIDAGATDLVIAPKTAVKLEIVGNEIYRVL